MQAIETFRALSEAHPRPAGWALPPAPDGSSPLAVAVRAAQAAGMSAGLSDEDPDVAFFHTPARTVLVCVGDGAAFAKWRDEDGREGACAEDFTGGDADVLAALVQRAFSLAECG